MNHSVSSQKRAGKSGKLMTKQFKADYRREELSFQLSAVIMMLKGEAKCEVFH